MTDTALAPSEVLDDPALTAVPIVDDDDRLLDFVTDLVRLPDRRDARHRPTAW